MTTMSLRSLLLVVVVVAFTVVPASAQEVRQDGDRYVVVYTKTFDVGPGGSLDLESRGGAVSVEAWDEGRTQVVERITVDADSRDDALRLAENATSTYDVRDGTLSVRSPRSGGASWRNRVNWSYDVSVPTRFGVEARTAGGPVSVDGVEGRVDARTAGGPVRVERVTGPVEARTSGGPVQLTDIRGTVNGQTSGGPIEATGITGDLTVNTSGGPIRVRSVSGDATVSTSGGDVEVYDAGGAVRARTSGGDIEGRGFGGSVEAETMAGDVELADVRGPVDARTSVGDIRVQFDGDATLGGGASMRSSNGDVELVLPPGLEATLDVEVRARWSGRLDRDDIYSDFPVTREADRNSNVLRATGTLNGGGPTLRVRTDGGSVEIKKSE